MDFVLTLLDRLVQCGLITSFKVTEKGIYIIIKK